MKLLKINGCRKVREGEKHEYWYSPRTYQHFSVPRKLKGEGTLRRILRDAGIDAK